MDPEQRQAIIDTGRREKFHLTGASPSVQAAVQAFLDEISAAPAPLDRTRLQTLIQEDEFRRLVFPNFPDQLLSNERLTPDSEWRIEMLMRGPFLDALHASLAGKPVRVLNVPERKAAERRTNLILHLPGTIPVRDARTGRTFNVDLIGGVIEHNGQFKVAHIYNTDD